MGRTADWWHLCLVAACTVFLSGGQALRIIDLAVPTAVLNGSMDSIVLDCLYSLDNSSAAGLVVKWYHNRSPAPVYQWIPGYPPQAFGLLRGRVNLGHVISNDPQMRHRAIQLVHPRPELSGEFTCKVSTWSGVDTATKRMVIYSPVKSMSLSSSEPHHHHMSVTCKAEGMYPEPEVSLLVQRSRFKRERIRGLQVTKTLVDGAYSVRVTKKLDDREVPEQCLIHCEISLPHTGYSVTEKIPHIRGSASHSSSPMLGRKEKYTSYSWREMNSLASGVPSVAANLAVLAWTSAASLLMRLFLELR
ncbi:uncharacterized protein LOC122385836 [Amphibalanus amphitrite]|uniref:uncharacterized protein LOC122385836 n=1 Tax=Amphibalanus amphitrite TaxID=1232801 RepID=UPI001C90675E|nr:uncharacterized protein LOC122385836 [Amphibalanus amphitrite]